MSTSFVIIGSLLCFLTIVGVVLFGSPRHCFRFSWHRALNSKIVNKLVVPKYNAKLQACNPHLHVGAKVIAVGFGSGTISLPVSDWQLMEESLFSLLQYCYQTVRTPNDSFMTVRVEAPGRRSEYVYADELRPCWVYTVDQWSID